MKDFDRRQLLRGASGISGGLALSALLPGWAQSATPGLAPTLPTLTGLMSTSPSATPSSQWMAASATR